MIMRYLKMPPQLARLAIVAVLIVGLFLTARYFLVPPSFGQYGFFRGDALEEIAANARVYGGRESCEECHSEQVEAVAQAEHRTVSCEACHGVGSAHAEDPDQPVAKPTDGLCMRCHGTDPSRPAWIRQIEIKEHYEGSHCRVCHVPHQPNEVP